MDTSRIFLCVLVVVGVCASHALAQPTELSSGFTYQGRLAEGGAYVDGQYDFQLSLWSQEAGGAPLSGTELIESVDVVDGLFTISPDFGVAVFDGGVQWLQLEVKVSGGAGAFTTLNPRQEIKAAPYALQTRGLFVDTSKNVGVGNIAPQFRLHVTNAFGHAIVGEAQSATAQNFGVWGRSAGDDGRGVYGYANNATGMNYGVYGRTDSADNGRGIFGLHFASTGTGPGVMGQSNSQSANAAGVHGLILSTSPGGFSAGVYGENRGTAGAGIGVYGSHDGAGWGVYGEAAGTGGRGVFGRNDSATSFGVYGLADQIDSYGVLGRSSLGTGVYGLHGNVLGTMPGVLGETNSTAHDAVGVSGRASGPLGATIGVFGESLSSTGTGVQGFANALTGVGVFGRAAIGVRGHTDNADGTGVSGLAPQGIGTNYGVRGQSNSASGYGVYGKNDFGYAVYSQGDMRVNDGDLLVFNGDLDVTGTKSWCIEHPLDPEKLLRHFCEEGPQPRNVYRGRATLDANGKATVELPDYFEAINIDVEYHLTAIGAPMPNLHVAEEFEAGRFLVAGGEPHKSVSWTVTGIRNDAWVRENGAAVEVTKRPDEVGDCQTVQRLKTAQQQTASAAADHASGN